jgi:hypothetical protein
VLVARFPEYQRLCGNALCAHAGLSDAAPALLQGTKTKRHAMSMSMSMFEVFQ